MRKRWISGVVLLGVVLSMTGCGLANTAGDAVSGGAVSGEAVSEGAASGEAVGEAEGDSAARAAIISDIYPLCSSHNLYKMEDNTVIQCSLDGKKQKVMQMPGAERKKNEVEVKYVSDTEILYTVYRDYDGKESEYEFCDELWSVPVRQTDGENRPGSQTGGENRPGSQTDGENRPDCQDELLLDKAEKILEKADGIGGLLYVDENFIAWLDATSAVYNEYDRREKKFISVCSGDKKNTYYAFPTGKYGMANGYERFSSNSVLLETEDNTSIYAHKVGSGKIERVATHYSDRYSDGVNLACSGNRIYYTTLHNTYSDPYKEIEDEYSYDIWCYDGDTGENKILVREEQLRQIYPKFWLVDSLFTDGSESLYAIIYTRDGETLDLKVVKISLSGKQEIVPVEPLNKALDSDSDFLAYIYGFAADRCFYGKYETGEKSEEEYYTCNLSTGEIKKVTKGDPEYYFWVLDDWSWGE